MPSKKEIFIPKKNQFWIEGVSSQVSSLVSDSSKISSQEGWNNLMEERDIATCSRICKSST